MQLLLSLLLALAGVCQYNLLYLPFLCLVLAVNNKRFLPIYVLLNWVVILEQAYKYHHLNSFE